MFFVKSFFLSVVLCLICSFAFSSVKITVPKDVVMMTDLSVPVAVNRHNEVLFKYPDGKTGSYLYGIWSDANGIELVVNKKYTPWKGITDRCVIYKLENGVLTYTNKEGVKTHDIKTSLLSHDPELLNIPPSQVNVSPVDMNSSGVIVGNYNVKHTTGQEKSFIYNQENAFRFVLDDSEGIGYTVASSKLIAINENGTVLGEFKYGKKHPFKDKVTVEGTKYFVWDGRTHIIDIDPITSCYLNASFARNTLRLNNMDEVFFTIQFDEKNDEGETTFKWSKSSGTKIFAKDFYVLSVDDSGQTVGFGRDGAGSCIMLIKGDGQRVNLTKEVQKAAPWVKDIQDPFFGGNGTILLWSSLWGERQFVLVNID